MSSILNADDIKKALDAFRGKECICSFLVLYNILHEMDCAVDFT